MDDQEVQSYLRIIDKDITLEDLVAITKREGRTNPGFINRQSRVIVKLLCKLIDDGTIAYIKGLETAEQLEELLPYTLQAGQFLALHGDPQIAGPFRQWSPVIILSSIFSKGVSFEGPDGYKLMYTISADVSFDMIGYISKSAVLNMISNYKNNGLTVYNLINFATNHAGDINISNVLHWILLTYDVTIEDLDMNKLSPHERSTLLEAASEWDEV